MTNAEIVAKARKSIELESMRAQGRIDALNLRSRAVDMEGTEIIAEEEKIPQFNPKKDYSDFPVGSPVWELVDGEHQVFKLITPHNAEHYPSSTPSNTPALWSICHTKDPKKAKPYLPPNGTSGLYMTDEVCIKNSHLWRSKKNDNPYPPGELATQAFWEDLGPV